MNGLQRILGITTLLAFAGCGGGDETPTSCPDDCFNLSPAAPVCDGNTVVSLGTFGTCVDGTCEYPQTRRNCGADAECVDGECIEIVDLCEGVTCTEPPADSCEGTVALRHDWRGTCEPDSGACVYDRNEEDCALDGRNCVDGECVQPPDLCRRVVCETPPEDTCDGEIAVQYDFEGACDSATGECSYASETIDCEAEGRFCDDGECVELDPCDGVRCTTPPAATCDGTTLVSFARQGECVAGECEYTENLVNCRADGRICEAGACIEPGPCHDVACVSPPVDRCVGAVAYSYADTGTCSSGICSYDETVINCALTSRVCEDGACITPGPCYGVSCAVVPDNVCRGNESVSYRGPGECVEGDCEFGEVVTDCRLTGQYCVDGFCDPVCPLMPCSTPPEPTCEGTVSVISEVGNGDPCLGACTFDETRFDCADVGQRCLGGECVEPDPCEGIVCEQPEDYCDSDVAVSFAGPGTCVEGDCSVEEVITAIDCANIGRFCRDGRCLPPAALLEGTELVISELFVAPFTGDLVPMPDPRQQWIEIQNLLDAPLDVGGLRLVNPNVADSYFELPIDTVIPAGGQLVLGATALAANGNTDFLWEGSSLVVPLVDGTLVLHTQSAEIDRVEYGLDFGYSQFDAVQLDPSEYFGDNNDVANWCVVVAQFAGGQTGSPGELNYPCDDRIADGSVFFSEVMVGGNYPGVIEGERWIELRNNNSMFVDIGGLRIEIDGVRAVVPLGTFMGPGEYLVVAPNILFAGSRAAFVAEPMTMSRTSTALALRDGGFGAIARMEWNGTLTFPADATLQVRASALAAGPTSDPASFCSGTATYAGPARNRGTPGAGPDCGL